MTGRGPVLQAIEDTFPGTYQTRWEGRPYFDGAHHRCPIDNAIVANQEPCPVCGRVPVPLSMLTRFTDRLRALNA